MIKITVICDRLKSPIDLEWYWNLGSALYVPSDENFPQIS